MKHFSILLLLVIGTAGIAWSQPSIAKMKASLERSTDAQSNAVELTMLKSSQAAILFSPTSNLGQEQASTWLATQLGLRPGADVLNPEGKTAQVGDCAISQFHQYYKGIKVEHGVIKTTAKAGKVAMMQMEFYPIQDDFNTTPTLSEAEALKKGMAFINAKRYKWQDDGGNSVQPLPKGELVILQTYLEDDEICLAYKFDIYALMPLVRTLVYVDAHTGRIVLDDKVIKHSNAVGSAETRYCGTQQIVTDNGSSVVGYPYQLLQNRNGHEIETFNFNHTYPGSNSTAFYKFLDNDNNWTFNEFGTPQDDLDGLDVHFNMQVVSDYWKQVHNRNSWDDKYAKVINYVHVNEYEEFNNAGYNLAMDNAYWDGEAMYFGDGRNGAPMPPNYPYAARFNSMTSLDISGHELAHAVCQTTAALVYRWESGALNEGFSDIWAACIENFGISNNTSLGLNKNIWRIGEEVTINSGFGLRDMSDPDGHGHPSTYKGPFWIPGNFRECRQPDSKINDDCGVHTNSNVLNWWFYLLTVGKTGANAKGTPYSVAGLGFTSSQKIAYLTELNLTPNAGFATCRSVSINAAITLFGASSAEVLSVKNAWLAAAVDTNTFDMSNTPVFTSNNFISIGVGAKGNIWAGTAYQGLYRYNDTAWTKRPEITNVRINDIKADKAGGIWIAQSGTQGGGSAAIAGGVNYLPSPYTGVNNFYTVSTATNVPSRNARCIYVDTSKVNGTNPKVWVATQSYLNGSNNTSGKLGQGLYASGNAFIAVSDSLNTASATAGITTVGGDGSKVWGFAPVNYGIDMILSYQAGSNIFIRSYSHGTDPVIPTSFTARAIYFDAKKRAWVGLANGGLLVCDESQKWHAINFPSMFSVGAGVNPNAITGDPYGDVYIGTTAGLVFFDHGIGEKGRLDSVQYYHLYNTQNGLPSNNINAIAYDTGRFKLLIATDNGVTFWEPPCLDKSCYIVRTGPNGNALTLGPGNWSNPAIWSNGQLPDSTTSVTLAHPVIVDVNAKCRSISAVDAGGVHVNAGVNLIIYDTQNPINTGGVRRRR